MNLILTILSALGSFIVTNIDDIFVLMLLFSQASSQAKASNGRTVKGNRIYPKDIVIGQYLGFALLVLISLLATFGVTLIPDQWVGLLGLIPIYLGVKLFIKGEDEDEGAILSSLNKFNKFYLSVAFITFANGGDNIGIYIPFFSTLNNNQLVITVVTFFIMVAVWCLIGYRLARFRYVSETLEKYGRWLIPIVFIGLGFYIMAENNIFSNLWSDFVNLNS
ncbi:cadmium resistance transport/sequestration family protein [Aerococcus sp. 150760007-1]|uniref:CadD family cadmium resistance transporter n=1 Tax=Aerococcus urinaeequi TaxID=51665 RepID=A0ABR5ZWC5_9LACT|nr:MULTISPECIES: CadD family cadmium resistance transporter [Bacilli]KAF3298622.1 CadD family cadmium resistance transporter [Carnobacterium sp. PL12RED10]KAF3298630.1 CadD family cadmium resistance transporter [Carnobacterium sp. PL26RED25]KAF3303873.1 CadD family cadmium resistance transporter [Carnobacterium sp. PL24RED07]KAF3304050.1 CadD family cadmium resistance transporter [Carnobacterium sp. PL17GRE32]MBA5746031.1 CadD family cadmium resistance transporter [Aerococcus urinaeequi]